MGDDNNTHNILKSPRTPTCGNHVTLNGAPAKAQISHGMIVGVPFRQLWRSLPVHDSNTTSRFILVRHGESTSNKEGLLCGGGTDTGLSEVGKRQARDVAACLKAEMVDLEALGSSNLIRALHTRDIIGQHLPNFGHLFVEENFKEMMYGYMENKKIGGDVLAEMKNISGQWKAGNTDVQVGQGESPENVVARFLPAAKVVCKKYSSFLLVSHSHAIKSFLSHVGDLGLSNLHSLPQKNGAVNVVDYNRHADKFVVHGINLAIPEYSSTQAML